MQFGVQILDRSTGTTYPDWAIINTLLRIQIYFEEVEIYNWFKSIQERNVDTETEQFEISEWNFRRWMKFRNCKKALRPNGYTSELLKL